MKLLITYEFKEWLMMPGVDTLFCYQGKNYMKSTFMGASTKMHIHEKVSLSAINPITKLPTKVRWKFKLSSLLGGDSLIETI